VRQPDASPYHALVATALSLALAPGCHHEEGAACALEARPRSAAVGFDANSDGVMDVADGAWLLARNFRAGEDPPCPEAVEALGDRMSDSATAWAIWAALIGGTEVPTLEAGACAAPSPEEASCGDGLALSLDAPAGVTGSTGSTASFSASVLLSSPDLPVEAWSLSVAATGCSVTAATLDGTLGADRRDDPPGQRDGGVGHAQPSTEGGAVSLVVLGPVSGRSVQPTSPSPILALTVEASVGASCADCALSLEDGQVGRGRPLSVAVSSGGRSYAPPGSSATVRVCPGS